MMNKKLKYIVIIFLIFGSENFSNGDSETIDKIQKIVKKKVGNINENANSPKEKSSINFPVNDDLPLEVNVPESEIIYAESENNFKKSESDYLDLSIWKTKRFQKEFLGSYGVNSEIEPRVSVVEQEQMQKVLDVMAEDESMTDALKLLNKYNKDSASAIFDFTIANLYFQQEEMSKALNFYNKAIEKFPNFRRAYKNAGLIYVKNSKFNEAIPFLTKTIELGEHSSLIYGLLGYAYGSLDKHLSAESSYRIAILLDSNTVDWKLGLAKSLFKQEKYGDAVSLCSSLIEKSPDNADFWILQANAFLGMKQPIRAAENYEYVNLIGKATSASMTMLADIYVNDEKWDLATEAYLRSYELDNSENPENPLRAAKILASRGALIESDRILNRISEKKKFLSENNLKELLKLKARVAISQGETGNVVEILEEVVEVDPLDGEALILLAQHYGRNTPEKAIFYYERAANSDKHEAEANLKHGQLLVGQSKYGDAVPFLKRAYELKPRSDLEDYLKQVERIAKTKR